MLAACERSGHWRLASLVATGGCYQGVMSACERLLAWHHALLCFHATEPNLASLNTMSLGPVRVRKLLNEDQRVWQGEELAKRCGTRCVGRSGDLQRHPEGLQVAAGHGDLRQAGRPRCTALIAPV